jgi:hypothetical protein
MSQHSFDEAKSVIMARHQQAIADAQRVFAEAVAQVDADHRAFKEAYQARWDEVRSDPTHPSLHIIRLEYEKSLAPPDHEPARHVLAKSVYDADNDYHAELRKVASQHGVSMSAPPLSTRGI